jgi:zinc transport system permease protein
MNLFNVFNYVFIQKALITGSFIAILCSSLGVFLVLRRLSLIGDGLAHVSFGSIALGLFLGFYPIYIAIPVVMISSILILKLVEKANIYGDAAIGIISSLGIAAGVILASISNGFNIDLFSYLFGNILAISNNEMYLSVLLSLIVIIIIITYYNDLFSITFDEEYAKVSGVNTKKINHFLVLFTAISVILAIKVVGTMLVSALLIIPPVTSLQISKGFKSSIWISVILSATSVILGIFISYYIDIPTGATIVLVNLAFFLISFVIKKIK